MPPFEIKPIEIPKIPDISLSGERMILKIPEISPTSPSLSALDFTSRNYPLSDEWESRQAYWNEMKIDPNLLPNGGVRFFDWGETALAPLKKGELVLAKPNLVDRFSWDIAGVAGGAFTGGIIGGAMYLLGAGLTVITVVFSAIAALNVGFGFMVGMFARSGGTPGFEIPVDKSGNHYAIGTYPHPWLPIRSRGDVIAYPVNIKRIDGERVEVSFKIFGLPRPFTLTMSESYARHRKLIPDQNYPKPATGYYLIWGKPHRSWWLQSLERAEAENKGVSPFRLASRSSSFFAEGFDADLRPVRVYRPGDQPSSTEGEIKFVGALEVYQGGEPGLEKLRVHFQEFDPYLDSVYSEEFFSIPLPMALKMGLLLQDLNGMLKRNPAMTHVFVEERGG